MARFLLVAASFEDVTFLGKTQVNSHYPLGLAYLHSYLESRGHTVRTLALNHEPFANCREQVLAGIKAFSPDTIGFQILTSNRVATMLLVDEVHQLLPSVPILLVGIHTSVMYSQLLDRFPYAIAVLGEGEQTCDELLQALASSRNIEDVPGIAFRSAGKVRLTALRTLWENLDELPFPKHDIFFTGNRSLAGMLSSRGCAFKCSFCVLDSFSRRRVRFRSPENVLEEIDYLARTFPNLQTIWFHDDSFFFRPERAIAICEGIIRLGIRKNFVCSARFKPISQELVNALERAGFGMVLFGLESGSEKILQLAHKHITQDDAIKAIELFRHRNIRLAVFLIVGLYGETRETLIETARFFQRLQKIKYFLHPDGVAILNVYPGTEIYELCKQQRLLEDKFWLTDQPTPVFTVEHDLATLQLFRDLLLDHVSLFRLPNPRALHFQRTLIPQILKFLLFETPPREAMRIVAEPLLGALRSMAPGLVDSLLALYRNYRS